MRVDLDTIRPYTDSETVRALRRISFNPTTIAVSRYLWPQDSVFKLSRLFRKVDSIDGFQAEVMSKAVESVLQSTSEGLQVRGIENLDPGRKYLFISNHRDIVMDPALVQYALFKNGIPLSELCVGNNLLSSRYVETLMRSNRMVKVFRNLPPHDMVEFSRLLSSYIREKISKGESSIWIAHRQGRSKDSTDLTSQGIIKMLEMSGKADFATDISELRILPVSLSYEYESCDALRARELLISRDRKYVKAKGEDLKSILTGIRQNKGHICISFGKVLTPEEIAEAASLKGNERFRRICTLLNDRIHGGYRLWKTNYMGCDLMKGESAYLGREYSAEELEAFKAYAASRVDGVCKGLDRNELLQIFYEIYGNPVKFSQTDARA